MNSIIFILNTVGPVFALIILGYFLKRIGIIEKKFTDIISQLVFNVALPALLFMKLAFIDLSVVFNMKVVFIVYVGTAAGFLLSWFIASATIIKGHGRGTFIQGSFRGNLAILGMAIVLNIFGDQGAARMATILVFLIPLYNVLSIIALTFSDTSGRKEALRKSLRSLAVNPLIISIFISILVSWWSIPVHSILVNTVELLSEIALPLALLGIGSSLEVGNIFRASRMAIVSSLFKIILMPLIGVSMGYLMGFDGENLVIIYIVFACPTAIVSYIMADAMSAHGKLAGSIVVISTLGSIFTISLGIFIFRILRYI